MSEYPVAYSVYNRNNDIRLRSTSGGVFTAIAEHFITNHNGAVYGAAFDESFNVVHKRVVTIEGLQELRGSKYPQSKIGKCFIQARDDLEGRKLVFFTGTPCQIEGLKRFLRKDYENLFCLDFVCHGVASDSVWRSYVELLETKGEISSIVFKHKLKGWKKWYFHVTYKDGSTWFRRGNLTKFMSSYLSYANIRPSCYECHFKGVQRLSDFTISDCWGIGEQDSTMNDDKGLSALLLQNERAEQIFESIKGQLQYKQYNAHELMQGNWTTLRSVPENPIRSEFFGNVANHSPGHALNKYFTPSLKRWLGYYYRRLRGTDK